MWKCVCYNSAFVASSAKIQRNRLGDWFRVFFEFNLRDLIYEKNVPTKQYKTKAQTWISRPHENPRWSGCDQSPPSQGPKAAECMTSTGRSDHRFPVSCRLKKSSEFSTVFQKHRKVQNQFFRILIHYHRSQPQVRLGVIVSRRVSRRAVQRNRIKRQIRDCFRLNKQKLSGCDLIVIANRSCESATNAQLQTNLANLLNAF